MKSLAALTLGTLAIAGGWVLISSEYAHSTPVPIHLEPVMHAKFDPAAIGRNIAFHTGRVKRDPEGPIGWSMLADAYLAESREYDSDKAAWKAEAAARKSLSLRTRGNERGKAALVASLLEQHRFQDALHTLDSLGIDRGRLRADVLIELGQYEGAERLLAMARQDDPSVIAAKARIASLQGDPATAAALLSKARDMSADNAGVGETTLAWYDVKLGDALVASKHVEDARKHYASAIRLHPRSYKAHLALARLNLAQRQWDQAIAEGEATMKIANSLDARSVIGDAYLGSGDKSKAEAWYASCLSQYKAEVATFDHLHKGGPLHVKPIDRQFATFAAAHRRYEQEAMFAAKRDLQNRPDLHAKETLQALITN